MVTIIEPLVGCVVIAAACVAVSRSQVVGLVLALSLFIPTSAFRNQLNLSANAGTFHIFAADISCAVLMIVGCSRALARRPQGVAATCLLILVGLFALHVVRGVSAYGLQTATNSSRTWFYLLGPAAYALTVPVPWSRRALQWIVVAAMTVAAGAFVYVVIYGVQNSSQEVLINGQPTSSRGVVAAGALLILEGAVMTLALRWPTPVVSRWLALLAVIALLLVDQRTVWIAGLACLGYAFISWSRSNVREVPSAVFGATGVALITIPPIAWLLAGSATIRVSVDEAVAKRSTFSWRVDSWRELIGMHHSVTELIVGEPAGLSWARELFGVVLTDASAHSSYVEALLRFGVLGLASFLVLMVALWRSRENIAGVLDIDGTAVGALLIAQVLFSVTYVLGTVDGLLIGMLAASAAVAEERVRATSVQPVLPSRGLLGEMASGGGVA